MGDYIHVKTRVTWHALLDGLMEITLRLQHEEVSEYDVERMRIATTRVSDLLERSQRAVRDAGGRP